MAGDDFVSFDLEVPTPEQMAKLRQQGVVLPGVSAASADPRNHSDFVDNRLNAVGYGIYLFGMHLYVDGVALPIHVPSEYIQLGAGPVAVGDPAIYPDRTQALAALAGKPAGSVAFYRSWGGLIVPTIFSPGSAPRTCATLQQAMADLGQQVSNELVALALSLIGARVFSAAYSRLMRAVTKWGQGPMSPSIRPKINAGDVGAKIGEQVKAMPKGKTAGIADGVSRAGLSQADAATAVGEASRVAFGKIGGTAKLPNGDVVVLPAKIGADSPVFVVRPGGQVRPGTADLEMTQPLNIRDPVTVKNVRVH